MFEVGTVGVDLAKNVIQVHGVDADGKTVLRHRTAAPYCGASSGGISFSRSSKDAPGV